MAGIKFNGSTGYLEMASALIGAGNMTMVAFVSADVTGGGQVWVQQAQSNGDRFTILQMDPNGSAEYATLHNPGNTSSAAQQGAPNISATYQLVMGTFTGGTSRSVALGNNTFYTDNAVLTDDKAQHDRITIGALHYNNLAPQNFVNGSICEIHFYNVVLTATDFNNIKNGTVKPEAIAGWVDGWIAPDASSLTSISGTHTLAAFGGVSNSTLAAPISRVASVPVSFSGPVPTRNGVLGTATTFANAGFFAGNLTPFTYSSVGTALPAGVTLNTSTGVLSLAASGATAGTTSGIIIRATDTGSNIANTNAYSIVIAASNAAPTFPGNISNLSGTAGSAITPVNVSGQFSDTDTLTYSASTAGTAWPSGLVVNSSTGIISGTVASAGTTSGLKVRATDTASQTVDSNAFNVVIAAGSATRTWTPTIKLEALADETPFANWAVHAVINDMAGNKIDAKTGLTTSSAGLPPPFTTTTGSLATDYRVTYIDDVDLTIFAVENLRCV